jgi:UDP-N-acetylmuramoyl-L-alanyl-D-glutamate--2,6-diaminopimelate ligase
MTGMTAEIFSEKGYEIYGNRNAMISGIAYDSRMVNKGDMFIAVAGEKVDGHCFINAAIEAGASAILFEHKRSADSNLKQLMDSRNDIAWIQADDTRDAMAFASNIFYGAPSDCLNVIGITGTNGKTTTSYLIRSAVEAWGMKTGLIGTITYLIGDESYDAPHTTPESPDFQKLLRKMADSGCSYVVAEVSSHALSQKRADYTRFKVAIFTNLTRDHLDYHETMEDYFSAKTRLFTELLTQGGSAVINIDDPYGRRLVELLTVSRPDLNVITFGIESKDAALRAYDISMSFKGVSFSAHIKEAVRSLSGGVEDIALSCPLVGMINVYNALAAAGAALSLKIPVKIIKEGVVMTELVKGRFEKVDLGQDFLAVVDYAHTEDALKRLLLTARQLLEAYHFTQKTERMMKAKRKKYEEVKDMPEKGKIITVFGCGGNRDKGKRSKMGEIAANLSDFVIITSDNPRNEDPKGIIRDIEKGMAGDNYIVIPDRNVAISMAVELASAGDIVLVAGKGHEDYQEIQDIRHEFSDKNTLESAIRRAINRPSFGGGSNYKGTQQAQC